MKKFSRIATAGLVFAAGLSLAACHPPNQQDSTSEKIDNASTYTGTAPGLDSQSSTALSSSAVPGAEEEYSYGLGTSYANEEGQAALETGVTEPSVAPAQ